MTPRVKSASKRDFLTGLGLDAQHPGTQALYNRMKVIQDIDLLKLLLIVSRMKLATRLLHRCVTTGCFLNRNTLAHLLHSQRTSSLTQRFAPSFVVSGCTQVPRRRFGMIEQESMRATTGSSRGCFIMSADTATPVTSEPRQATFMMTMI